MSGRVEKLMQGYQKMVMERSCLENQLRNFQGITEEEMIDSLHFSQPDGERLQTSDISDKTGRIAISYKDKMDQINKDWQAYLEKKHAVLVEELLFFESAVLSLSGILPEFVSDMVINGRSWEELASQYHISRSMVAKNRKKAIRELEYLYVSRDKELAEYMLS